MRKPAILHYGDTLPPATEFEDGDLFYLRPAGELYIRTGGAWALSASSSMITSVQNDGTGVELVSDTGTSNTAKVRTITTTGNGISPAVSSGGGEVELSFDKVAAGWGAANGFATLDGSKKVVERLSYEDTANGVVNLDAQKRIKDGFNVTNYGAVGDGVTDDTTAIQNAVNASDYVVFPPGNYYITNTITVSANKVLRFMPGASITTVSTISAPAIKVTGSNVKISGGTIDLQKSGTTVDTNVSGVEASSADGLVVTGLTVQNSAGYGIWVYDSSNVKIQDCKVTDSNYIGIFVQPKLVAADILNVEVSGNHVDRTSLGTGVSEGGIKVRGDGTNSLYYAKVFGNHVAMPTSPTDGSAICIELWGLAPRSTVFGNTTTGGAMGISIDESSGVSVTGNTVYGASMYGIELAASPNCTVASNTIDGNSITTKGVALTGATAKSHNSIISGNTITNINGNAIYGYSGTNGISCTNNTIVASTSYVINVEVATGWSIVGNTIDCQSSAAKGIFLNKVSDSAIAGNTILDYTETGIMLYSATAYDFDKITITGNTVSSSTGSFIDKQLATGSTLGSNIRIVGNSFQPQYLDYGNGVSLRVGSGSPEGVYTASPGSLYLNISGGASTTLYVKESGTGNTGWIAK